MFSDYAHQTPFELRLYGVTLSLAITSLTLMATFLLLALPQSLKGSQIDLATQARNIQCMEKGFGRGS